MMVDLKSRLLKGIDAADECDVDKSGSLDTVETKQTTGRGRTKTKRTSDNVAAGPLPPALEELERVFTALNTVHGFLQRQRMQATWVNVKQSLQQLCFPEGDEKICLQAVKNIATLCPKASHYNLHSCQLYLCESHPEEFYAQGVCSRFSRMLVLQNLLMIDCVVFTVDSAE